MFIVSIISAIKRRLSVVVRHFVWSGVTNNRLALTYETNNAYLQTGFWFVVRYYPVKSDYGQIAKQLFIKVCLQIKFITKRTKFEFQ